MVHTLVTEALPKETTVRSTSLAVLERLRNSKPGLHAKLTQLMRIPPVRVASYSERSLGAAPSH